MRLRTVEAGGLVAAAFVPLERSHIADRGGIEQAGDRPKNTVAYPDFVAASLQIS